jgi:hypothetical protein
LLEEKRREFEDRKAQAASRKEEFETAKALEVQEARRRAAVHFITISSYAIAYIYDIWY